MTKKGRTKEKKRLKQLSDEYLSLLMLSEVFGVTISEEGEMLKDMISEHPEYRDHLHQDEITMADGTTVNPRLHIAVEAAVQRQISKSEPPEARDAYLALLREGLDPHEARHAVGHLFLETIWRLLHNASSAIHNASSANHNEYYRQQLRDLIRLKRRHPLFASSS
jgi:hypothetical protein